MAIDYSNNDDQTEGTVLVYTIKALCIRLYLSLSTFKSFRVALHFPPQTKKTTCDGEIYRVQLNQI